MNAAEGRITDFLAAANAALEEGDFQLADKRLAEAEDAQLASTTLPALEKQYRLRFERGHAALLGGEIGNAAQHWERSANYFHFVDKEVEAERDTNIARDCGSTDIDIEVWKPFAQQKMRWRET